MPTKDGTKRCSQNPVPKGTEGSRLRELERWLPTESDESALLQLAADMEKNGFGRHDPVREVFALLGDRWSTLILLVLSTGERRQAMLRRLISILSAEGDISQRVLTLKLRALERDGFVTRAVSADIPPHVTYALSPLGMALSVEAARLVDWVRGARVEIDTARDKFDSEDGSA